MYSIAVVDASEWSGGEITGKSLETQTLDSYQQAFCHVEKHFVFL